MKRRLLVACTVIASILLLAGCGAAAPPATTGAAGAAGGTDTTATTATDPAAAGAVGDTTATNPDGTPAAAAAPAAPTPPTAEVLAPGDQIKTSQATPKAFVNAKCKSVIVFYAYQPGGDADMRMLLEVNQAVAANKGSTLMLYTPSQYKDFGDLPQNLGVFDLPSVTIINKAGKLQNQHANFWPSSLIDASIKAALNTKSSVCESDAPPSETDAMAPLSTATASASAATTGTEAATGAGVADPSAGTTPAA